MLFCASQAVVEAGQLGQDHHPYTNQVKSQLLHCHITVFHSMAVRRNVLLQLHAKVCGGGQKTHCLMIIERIRDTAHCHSKIDSYQE